MIYQMAITADDLKAIRDWWNHPKGAQMKCGDDMYNYKYAVDAVQRICEFAEDRLYAEAYNAVEEAQWEAQDEYGCMNPKQFVYALEGLGFKIVKTSDI